MEFNNILALLGTLGGFEAVKWLINSIVHRKTNARRENAKTNSLEHENERKQVDWLEERLNHRDAKIDALYNELRKEQTDKTNLIHEKHAVEMKLKEVEVRRCDVRGCKDRQPPGDF